MKEEPAAVRAAETCDGGDVNVEHEATRVDLVLRKLFEVAGENVGVGESVGGALSHGGNRAVEQGVPVVPEVEFRVCAAGVSLVDADELSVDGELAIEAACRAGLVDQQIVPAVVEHKLAQLDAAGPSSDDAVAVPLPETVG